MSFDAAMFSSIGSRPVTPSICEVLDDEEPPSPIDPRFAPRPPTPMPIDVASTQASVGVAASCPPSPMPPFHDSLDHRYALFEPIPGPPHPFGTLPQRLFTPTLPRQTLRPQHSCSSISTFAQAPLRAPSPGAAQTSAVSSPASACASSAASRDVPVPPGLSPLAIPQEWHGQPVSPASLGHIPFTAHALLDRLVSLVLMPVTVPLLVCVFWYCAWKERKSAWHMNKPKGSTSTQPRDDLDDSDYQPTGPDDDWELDHEPSASLVTDSDQESDDSVELDDEEDDAALVHGWWREQFSGVDMARERSWGAGSPPPSPPIVRRTKDGLLDW